MARAKADGYTLLFGSVAPNVILPAAYGDKLPYDQKKDFAPIALVAEADYVLLVSTSLPITTLKELVSYGRQNPEKLTYASSGNLSGPHLAGQLLDKLANIRLVHVPYRGNGPALTALMGGEVSMTFDSAGGVVARGKSERYRVIAVTGNQTLAAYPEAPNLGKVYPGHNVSQWYGVFATAGTPPAVVARLRQAVNLSVNSEAVKKSFAEMGLSAVHRFDPRQLHRLCRRRNQALAGHHQERQYSGCAGVKWPPQSGSTICPVSRLRQAQHLFRDKAENQLRADRRDARGSMDSRK